MPILEIKMGVEFPGQRSIAGESSTKWDELRRAASALYVGGDALVVALEDDNEIESAQSCVHYYAKKLKSRDRGWIFQTTRRDKSLFIRKVAVGKR